MTITHDRKARELYESDFARLFNEDNPNWSSNSEHNRLFIEIQLNYLREKLRVRGHLFLNDAYELIGFPRIPQGQLIGWFFADGKKFTPRLTIYENGTILIEFNVTNSDVMYYKI